MNSSQPSIEELQDNELEEEKGINPLEDFWRKFKKQKIALIAGVFILLLVILAIIGPFIVPFDVTEADYGSVLEGPSLKHWAGTDEFGRDILSRVVVGTRISLSVGFFSVFIGAFIGTVLGLISGYYGGKIDNLIMRSCDVLFAFPGILLAIGIIAILGPGLVNVVYAVATFTIPIFARIARSSTLAVGATLYVEATKSIGARNWRIILRHIFPGTVSSLIVYFTMRLGLAILTAASLSFLGLGAQPPTPEWGAMLSSGRDYLNSDIHVTLFPGLAIFLTVLAFNLLGDGLRDALDPKIDE